MPALPPRDGDLDCLSSFCLAARAASFIHDSLSGATGTLYFTRLLAVSLARVMMNGGAIANRHNFAVYTFQCLILDARIWLVRILIFSVEFSNL